MSKIMFFNPDDGRKIGECEGTVWPSDMPAAKARPWGDDGQGDPVRQVLDVQKKLFDLKRDDIGVPRSYTATGTATVHVSSRHWKRMRRALGLRKGRMPRKWKKAARRIHIEVANKRYQTDALTAQGDVKVQVDLDYRILVNGRRTRMTERVAARLRWLLSDAYRRMMQHHLEEMMKLRQPGMLTYDPPETPLAVEPDPRDIIFRQQSGGYVVRPSSECVISHEQRDRLTQIINNE